jgi:ABC-type transport system involved in multi-copper enzyme maturation permease subunit
MSARRIGLVAWHVFKESIRDRVLYGIAAFAVLLVASSVLLGEITAGQDLKIIKDLGLSTIEFAGVLMSVFIGVGLVAREIDRRSIYSLLAKPLRRSEFIVGKYVGLVLTTTTNVVLMTAALYVMLAWMWWISPVSVRLSWDAPALDPRLLVEVVLIAAELALLTAVALFFSTFSSSTLWSVVFTIGAYLVGVESADLRHFNDIVRVNGVPSLGHLVAAIGWIVPAFNAFDRKIEVVHGIAVPWGFVANRVLYAALYAGVTVGGAIAIFSRREFK